MFERAFMQTADVYFLRAYDILEAEGVNPFVKMEVFCRKLGVLCGIKEVTELLRSDETKEALGPLTEVWSLSDGNYVSPKEVVLRIEAPYQSFGVLETQIIGTLSHCTGWATAARECADAAGGIPVQSFGARHVHPSVVGVMDYSAVIGGCKSCSSLAGAELAHCAPSGTMPHALMLVMGSTVEAAGAFDDHMPADVPRIVLVDTFRDEVEESLAVARAMAERAENCGGAGLDGVRLDTPSERGGVTPDLVREVRARLDLEGFERIGIYVSGGFTPDKIRQFVEEKVPVNGFGIGSYISGARPIDFTADIHEVNGKPVAKRGRIPGATMNSRLKRVL